MAAPYPVAPRGTKIRRLPWPCDRPEPEQAEPVPSTRRDGSTCNWRRTLPGLAPAPGDADMGVHDWRPVA